MDDLARSKRKDDMLAQCNPVFANRVKLVYDALEAEGWRPRLQDAWRSQAETLRLYKLRLTSVKWSFHNALNEHGKPDSLAVHVFDDDAPNPASPSLKFIMRLCYHARRNKLQTGITFGLLNNTRLGLLEAIDSGETDWEGKIGWDSCHLEVAGISIAQARQGVRPK